MKRSKHYDYYESVEERGIKTPEDGLFVLINRIMALAKSDYGDKKNWNKEPIQTVYQMFKYIDIDPIREWEESRICQITKDYYHKLNKKERCAAV